MKDLNDAAFISLFKDACAKCFGVPLAQALTETESKHLANQLLEKTGLTIGAKSLKNYSLYVVDGTGTRTENPSAATLDTLARYVLDAPYTNEIQRKDNEGHFPYWFQYKSAVVFSEDKPRRSSGIDRKYLIACYALISLMLVAALAYMALRPKAPAYFKEDFHTTNEDSLAKHGWIIKNKDLAWWAKKGEKKGYLSLYTLRGDNWTDSVNKPAIKNLLLKPLPSACFTAEIEFNGFIPHERWQQAGILLLEDTTLLSKSLRLSLAYNDFFGGYKRPREIIVQAIHSTGTDYSKPEEIVHLPVMNFDPATPGIVNQNLQRSALKIEKNGNHFRFLYGTGSYENFAYKEALTKDLNITPKYIAIFALQGFVDKPAIPVKIKLFSITSLPCN